MLATITSPSILYNDAVQILPKKENTNTRNCIFRENEIYYRYQSGSIQKGERFMFNFLTVKEAGEKWGVTSRMVSYHCENGRIQGAFKKGNLWLIPEDAKKPKDKRYKANKEV